MGIDLASLHAAARAACDQPFHVGTNSGIDLAPPPVMIPEDVPQFDFVAPYGRHATTRNLDWTLDPKPVYRLTAFGSEPVGQTVPCGIQAILDVNGRPLYAIDDHDAYELTVGKCQTLELKVTSGLPRYSWLTAIALDEKRKRVLFTSREWFYAFDVTKREWSVVSRLARGESVVRLAYDATADRLLALERGGTVHGDDIIVDDIAPLYLVERKPEDAAEIKRIRLHGVTGYGWLADDDNIGLFTVVKGQLIVLIDGVTAGNGDIISERAILLIDRETGLVRCAARNW